MPRIDEYKEVAYPFPNTRAKPVPGEMQVMRSDTGEVKAVDFLCPCGCGRNSYTSVCTPEEKALGKVSGRWGYDPATVTLIPSVLWLSGCKSHFFIRNGKVEWC